MCLDLTRLLGAYAVCRIVKLIAFSFSPCFPSFVEHQQQLTLLAFPADAPPSCLAIHIDDQY